MPNLERKNDGTDPKKNDGVVNSITVRSCFIVLVNNWGGTITNVTLTHNQGSNNDVIALPQMLNNTSSFQKQINYETGLFSHYDYWNVSFTDAGGNVWKTPNNDRCNISAGDEGTTVNCVVSGSNQKLLVQVVGGCTFEITQG